jgi:mitochondrial import inner membrane translocase subunit TIM50
MLARLGASRRFSNATTAFSKNRPRNSNAGGSLWQIPASVARRHQSFSSSSTATVNTPPTMMMNAVIRRPKSITKQERAALRSARKEQASRLMQAQQSGGATTATSTTASASATAAASTSTASSGGAVRPSMLLSSRWMWYLGLGIPTGLLIWGLNDPDSPPAKFSQLIGLSSFIASYTDQIARPSHEKLLPDWSQMPNVPQDIPIPHTLVLDLENTLVSSTWDRKYGWRHAKRPGVDKFLTELAQYYEIVLYSPSIDAVADPVVTHLDKHGAIMHRLYRDATYYHNGVHVKDLRRLNRNVKRMIVIDDDAAEVAFNPENLIRVKPYTDPTDRSDTTLERLIPFLLEIARDGHDDIPALLQQYQGMDADEIADEQERRLDQLRRHRQDLSSRGFMGGLAQRAAKLQPHLPPPAEPAMASYGGSSVAAPAGQLTAKDIVGSAGRSSMGSSSTLGDESEAGLAGFLNRRAREKEEQAQRKLEKWNEVMMKNQQEKKQRQQREQQETAAAR